MKKVLVTGGNTGIGFALCKQLAVEDKCHVFLCSRNEDKGKAAVSSILKDHPDAKVELVIVDVGNDDSVKTLAKKLEGTSLYALVNNAGAGLAHGVSSKTILNVNLHGPKRMCDAVLSLLDKKIGRIVNVSSGAASAYMQGSMMGKPIGKLEMKDKSDLLSFDVTWEQIQKVVEAERIASGGEMDKWTAYCMSKAALTAYTMTLAKEHKNIIVSSCSPGFIATNMTKGFNAKLTPEQGTVSIRHCLFKELGGNGWYYGSDGLRSPLDKGRDPGTPEYKP